MILKCKKVNTTQRRRNTRTGNSISFSSFHIFFLVPFFSPSFFFVFFRVSFSYPFRFLPLLHFIVFFLLPFFFLQFFPLNLFPSAWLQELRRKVCEAVGYATVSRPLSLSCTSRIFVLLMFLLTLFNFLLPLFLCCSLSLSLRFSFLFSLSTSLGITVYPLQGSRK